MRLRYVLGIMVLAFTLSRCHSTKTMSDDTTAVASTKSDFKGQRQLIDYLRRTPGVEVRGGGNNVLVLVRGPKSISGNNNPLYVVDGVIIGDDYNQVASMADRFAIENVVVLPPPRSARYGARGQNGVIEITTRKE